MPIVIHRIMFLNNRRDTQKSILADIVGVAFAKDEDVLATLLAPIFDRAVKFRLAGLEGRLPRTRTSLLPCWRPFLTAQ